MAEKAKWGMEKGCTGMTDTDTGSRGEMCSDKQHQSCQLSESSRVAVLRVLFWVPSPERRVAAGAPQLRELKLADGLSE